MRLPLLTVNVSVHIRVWPGAHRVTKDLNDTNPSGAELTHRRREKLAARQDAAGSLVTRSNPRSDFLRRSRRIVATCEWRLCCSTAGTQVASARRYRGQSPC
jgi:hypothetical protein